MILSVEFVDTLRRVESAPKPNKEARPAVRLDFLCNVVSSHNYYRYPRARPCDDI